jgi:hypothetical protein
VKSGASYNEVSLAPFSGIERNLPATRQERGSDDKTEHVQAKATSDFFNYVSSSSVWEE